MLSRVLFQSPEGVVTGFLFTGPANAFQAQNKYSFCTPLVWIPSAYLQATGSEIQHSCWEKK